MVDAGPVLLCWEAVGSLSSPVWLFMGVLLVPSDASSCSGELGCHLARVILTPRSCIQCYRPGELALAKHEAGGCSAQARAKALQPVESFKGAHLTESALFFNFFLFFQFSQMLGFVSHLSVIKSRLLVTEELVERRGFPPVCHFELGCEKSWAHVAPGRHLAWVREPGKGGRVGKEGPCVQLGCTNGAVLLLVVRGCAQEPDSDPSGSLLRPGMELEQFWYCQQPVTQSFVFIW